MQLLSEEGGMQCAYTAWFGMASASDRQRLRFLICPGYHAVSVQGGHGIMFLPSMVLVLLLCRVYSISGTSPVPVIT